MSPHPPVQLVHPPVQLVQAFVQEPVQLVHPLAQVPWQRPVQLALHPEEGDSGDFASRIARVSEMFFNAGTTSSNFFCGRLLPVIALYGTTILL
jgi:hypothetical protein